VSVHALHARRVACHAGDLGAAVRPAGVGRQPALRAGAPRHHRALRPLPAPQRHPRAREQRRGAGLPAATRLVILMRPRVRTEHEAEYFFREGCHITEWWNVADDPALSVARARIAPGVTTRWHRLAGVSERYVILQGEGRVELEH